VSYQPKHALKGSTMSQIIADAEELFADLEAEARALEAKGETEAAHVVNVLIASFSTLVEELKKLL
jgi:hypothetical protein